MPERAITPWVNVGPGGTFKASGKLKTSPGDIAALTAALAAGEKQHLVLYFHGGLVSEAAGFDQIPAFEKLYRPTPAVFVGTIWETGFFETFDRWLKDFQSSRVFKKLLSWAVEKAGEMIGAEGGKGGVAPPELQHSIVEERLESEDGVEQVEKDLEATASLDEQFKGGGVGVLDDTERYRQEMKVQGQINQDKDLIDAIDDDEPVARSLRGDASGEAAKGAGALFLAKKIIEIVFASIDRARKGTAHGIYPTLVEETVRATGLDAFGKDIWEKMKFAARDMWLEDKSGATEDQQHVGRRLLVELSRLQQQRPEFRIDLVGHSAGSIAICELLKTNRVLTTPMKISRVVFLAPACRFDLFNEQVVRHAADDTWFRLFTMKDEKECSDRLVPLLYTRSLLYFISGLLEEEIDSPILGQARHIQHPTTTAGKAYDPLRDWLSGKDRTVYSPTEDNALPGMGCEALSHGDFDNEERVMASLVAIAS